MSLVNVLDDLNRARAFVNAASMATASLDQEDRNALDQVLDAADQSLSAAATKLQEAVHNKED